ncbi:hypothetical protein UK14_13075 [Streptomyces sp. NRRL F-4428]|nr:hypothetical protein UK14_13075 [Streptomyces sp. NRRL F-4428]
MQARPRSTAGPVSAAPGHGRVPAHRQQSPGLRVPRSRAAGRPGEGGVEAAHVVLLPQQAARRVQPEPLSVGPVGHRIGRRVNGHR